MWTWAWTTWSWASGGLGHITDLQPWTLVLGQVLGHSLGELFVFYVSLVLT